MKSRPMTNKVLCRVPLHSLIKEDNAIPSRRLNVVCDYGITSWMNPFSLRYLLEREGLKLKVLKKRKTSITYCFIKIIGDPILQ